MEKAMKIAVAGTDHVGLASGLLDPALVTAAE
jgi:hypothetical protein